MRNPNSSTHAAGPFYYDFYDSPLGLFGLVATPRGLCEINTRPGGKNHFKNYLRNTYPEIPTEASDQLQPVVEQLDEYFAGKRKRFTCKLDLSQGTEFQRRVWETLKTIPYGETRSYADIASSIHNDKAVRAVGSANGKNPIPIIVPCHRVINKSGGLGGYTGGLDKKRFLLELEGV